MPSCLLPRATLQRFVAWKLLITCTNYMSRIFNEAHKNFLIRKFLADYCEFDYTPMAPTNGRELHALSPPSLISSWFCASIAIVKYRRTGFLYGFYFHKLTYVRKLNSNESFALYYTVCAHTVLKSKRKFKIRNIELFLQ